MLKLFYSLLMIMFISSNIEACVTLSPSGDTYTVDSSGCVGGKPNKRSNHPRPIKPDKK